MTVAVARRLFECHVMYRVTQQASATQQDKHTTCAIAFSFLHLKSSRLEFYDVSSTVHACFQHTK